MIDNHIVGKTIAALRQSRGMTQQQLAATLNLSHQAVSKWENGAALPDVQTLLNLSRFFGITMEQLLSGEIPEDRVNANNSNPIKDIGDFFSDVVNGLFGATDPAEVKEEPAPEEARPQLDLEKLLQMAPFMSKSAVDEMLLKHREELTGSDIAAFAPYITRECLEKLIQNPETEITWETLQKIAPFLKREMVDRLAKLAAAGRRFVQEEPSARPGEDLGRAIGEVGKGVEKVVRRAARLGEDVLGEVTNAYNSFIVSTRSREDRVKALRRAACERALKDENWDWLAEHVEEIDDRDLLKAIAGRANELGMTDWVLEHLQGYVDPGVIDAAVEAGNWGWLGDHIWQFDSADQARVALSAAKVGHWLWLNTYLEQIDLGEAAEPLARAACAAGEQPLFLNICARCESPEGRMALADAVVADGNLTLLEDMAEHLPNHYFGRLCLARAQEGRWEEALRFAKYADADRLEDLMALAITEGNFQAIDAVDSLLSN